MWGDEGMFKEEDLTFEDGMLLCKHIYQCAIHKTLQGVIEEWEIFQKTHDLLNKLEAQRMDRILTVTSEQSEKERLDELLFKLNIDNIYATI